MDQDFHYYGTYFAARLAKFPKADSETLALCANFVDFLNNGEYAGYWRLTDNNHRGARPLTAGWIVYPRYTFPGLLASVTACDSVFLPFHFTPGNYAEFGPSTADVHGATLTTEDLLGAFTFRENVPGASREVLALNRPQSPLSRAIVQDAIRIFSTSDDEIRYILGYVAGLGGYVQGKTTKAAEILKKFRLAQLGIRAHVIADTWAHQDWSGLYSDLNTYWQLPGEWGRNMIKYSCPERDGDKWLAATLKSSNKYLPAFAAYPNFEASPSKLGNVGHGWIGHFADFSFLKYQYCPVWEPNRKVVERDNPTEFKKALIELYSMFLQAVGGGKAKCTTWKGTEAAMAMDRAEKEALRKVPDAWDSYIGDKPARVGSAEAWRKLLEDLDARSSTDDKFGVPNRIDVQAEPDKGNPDANRKGAVLEGRVQQCSYWTRAGTYEVRVDSDLHLFQVAADYHYRFVRKWLKEKLRLDFTDERWAEEVGPFSEIIDEYMLGTFDSKKLPGID